MCISYQQFANVSLKRMNIVKNNNQISTLVNLQNNTDVISRYGCNGNTHVHHVDPVYMHKFTCLFINRMFIKGKFGKKCILSYQVSVQIIVSPYDANCVTPLIYPTTDLDFLFWIIVLFDLSFYFCNLHTTFL